jgi:hypothetical protein
MSGINVARMRAISKGRKKIGAIDIDLFSTADELASFLNKN